MSLTSYRNEGEHKKREKLVIQYSLANWGNKYFNYFPKHWHIIHILIATPQQLFSSMWFHLSQHADLTLYKYCI